MAVYIRKRPSKSPPKYHTSEKCPMVKGYPSAYQAIAKPPADHTPCQRSGPCSRLTK